LAALYVAGVDVGSFAVAEATAELSPVSAAPGDPTGWELLALNPNFDTAETRSAFFDQMVLDQRLVIRLAVTRVYGLSLDPPVAG
jgi:hypothetical protein